MKIDAHQHFWIYQPLRDTWIDDTMTILQRDFLPGNLATTIGKNSIDGTIAVQADQSEEETYFLLDLSKKHDWIKGVVGWVDLRADDIEKKLEDFSKYLKLKGFRHIVQAEPDVNFMLKPEFQYGISLLKHFDFRYDILVYPKQLPAAIQLVENHPDQTFILDHIGKPLIQEKIIEPWAGLIDQLAQNPNVVCKLSGIITEADQKNWTHEDIKPYLDVVFKSFGSDRLMFGSDWPVCLLAGSYEQVVDLIKDYLKDYPEYIINKIFAENTSRIYKI
jgi:L-fuconolactonase